MNACISSLKMYGSWCDTTWFSSTISKAFRYIVVSSHVGIFMELCVTIHIKYVSDLLAWKLIAIDVLFSQSCGMQTSDNKLPPLSSTEKSNIQFYRRNVLPMVLDSISWEEDNFLLKDFSYERYNTDNSCIWNNHF